VLYGIIVLQKAQRVIEQLDGSLDSVEIEAVIESLADDPDPQEAWTAAAEPENKFSYVGENRKWVIDYEIDDQGSFVYVHSIERRPSANLDPR
jgi:hypothetical protein